MNPAMVGVESLCGSTVRINVHPAVAAAFQFSDDFPVCHNCICLIGFEMFCMLPVFEDTPCSDIHFRYAVAYSCLSRSRLLSVSGVYPSRRMYPLLQVQENEREVYILFVNFPLVCFVFPVFGR